MHIKALLNPQNTYIHMYVHWGKSIFVGHLRNIRNLLPSRQLNIINNGKLYLTFLMLNCSDIVRMKWNNRFLASFLPLILISIFPHYIVEILWVCHFSVRVRMANFNPFRTLEDLVYETGFQISHKFLCLASTTGGKVPITKTTHLLGISWFTNFTRN